MTKDPSFRKEQIQLADDRLVTFQVADMKDCRGRIDQGVWALDQALTKFDLTPVYRNKQNEILEVVTTQEQCYLFDNEDSYLLYREKVIVFVENGHVLVFALSEKADFEYLDRQYDLVYLEDLSRSPDQFYSIPDGRIIYIDEHWKEGMIYRSLDELLSIERSGGEIPIVAIPGYLFESPGEKQAD